MKCLLELDLRINPSQLEPSLLVTVPHLLETILPESEIRSDTVLPVVLPLRQLRHSRPIGKADQQSDHSVGVHALSSVELVVFEVPDDLLGKVLSTFFEFGHSVLGELALDGLHVAFQVREEGLDARMSNVRSIKKAQRSPSCQTSLIVDGNCRRHC